MARLGEIFDLQMGKTPSRNNLDYWNDGKYNWISIADLGTYQKYTDETKEKISELAVHDSGIKSVPANTVIMSFKLSLGKTAITSEKIYTNEAIMAFIPTGKYDVFPDYFYYLFSGKDWSKETNRAVMGATLNKATLSDISVVVPSFDEQRKIAAVLDKMSDLIAKRRQQLNKLDLMVKSKFVEMFGNPVQNPMQWPIGNLSEYIKFLTSGSRGWAKYFTDTGEYFITIKNVKNGKIALDNMQHISPPDNAEAKRTKVQEGDLLISITADLGRTGVVSKDIADHGGYINQHLTCIRLDKEKVHPLYVSYYMESEAGKNQFQAKNQSAVKAGLNFNSINSLRLMVPPIALQMKFVSFVEEIEKTKITISQSLEKLETLKKALMQEYFG